MKKLGYSLLKRGFDLGVSSTVLAATMPVMLPVALSIKATMGSPILFRQTRPGKNGVPFDILKFRTMRDLKEGEDIVSSDGDRITALGKFLRKTSLDEFPTFLNVLMGEMSVVGPRPLLMRYLPRYSVRQFRRHEVKPGITGWAQVNGRNSISWEEKFRLDVWYVEHRSLLLDTKILFQTIKKVLIRDGISSEDHVTMPEFMGSQASSI